MLLLSNLGSKFLRLFGRKQSNKKVEPSLRKACFNLFQKNLRPAAVTKIIPVSSKTCYRYYESFKKLKNYVPYSVVRQWLRDNPDFSEKVITLLSTSLDMPPEKVIVLLRRPWGLLGAMRGDWPNYRLERQRTELEDRLLAALEIIKFCEIFSQRDPNFVRETLKKIIMDRGEESPEA